MITGILTQAQNAKEQTSIAKEKELIALAYNAVKAEERGGEVTAIKLQEELEKNGSKATAETSGTGIKVSFGDTTGREYTVDENGNITQGAITIPERPERPEKPEMPDIPETDQKYFNFTFDEENKTASLTGIIDEYKSEGAILDGETKITSILIPKTVKDSNNIDYTVTSIGVRAFSGCTSLQEVYIPDGVTVIGNLAFSGCTSLQEVYIPDGVTIIGNSAFRDCTSLQEVYIPDGVTTIGSYVFYGCTSLQEVYIPDGVTIIAASTFSGCTSLQEVYIPDGVTGIGVNAFSGCTSLQKVYISNSVASIADNAFLECMNLKTILIDNVKGSIEGEKWGADNAEIMWLKTN